MLAGSVRPDRAAHPRFVGNSEVCDDSRLPTNAAYPLRVGQHRSRSQWRALFATAALVLAVTLVIGALFVLRPGADDAGDPAKVTNASAPTTGTPSEVVTQSIRRTPEISRLPTVRAGYVIKKKELPKLAPVSSGGVGTGLNYGPLLEVDAPIGKPVTGTLTASVANLPNRTSSGGFASSLAALTRDDQDFVMLNEVSQRSLDTMRSIAPAYDAYRDPAADRSTGGSGQSLNNVVMWRADRYNLVDAGRVKVIDNDTGYLHGQRFTWDRYATWATLQRKSDFAIVSIVSLHMPTNPAKFPAQPGGGGMSRVERYSRGMDVVVDTVQALAKHGPVLLGGDMNSHDSQGAWSAAAKMRGAGYEYAKDRGVMHLFFQNAAGLVSNQQIGVASDHPAIITTIDMNGVGPS